LWLAFGLVHSILAYGPLKNKAMQLMQGNYKYYRLLYSLLATANLSYIVWYHISLKNQMLWQPPLLQKITAGLLITTSTFCMLVCMKKYFADLSGIDALTGKTSLPHLEQTGLHAWIRHPLYTATLLFVWSIFLWQPSLKNLISCVCITAYTRIGIYFEEKKLLRLFGEEYAQYKSRVAMLWPKIKK
jgi:protein-S-isoprenylcysteine O-methyltransferase Ste14